MISSTSRRTPKHTPVLVKAALVRLGERLQRARRFREMTQEDLAHQSDVGVSTVRALEDGADGVSLGNLVKVLRGLQLADQLDDLLAPARDPEAIAFAVKSLKQR